MTLLGEAPAPVSARPTPTLIGPLCADAPASESSMAAQAKAIARSGSFKLFKRDIVSSLVDGASFARCCCLTQRLAAS